MNVSKSNVFSRLLPSTTVFGARSNSSTLFPNVCNRPGPMYSFRTAVTASVNSAEAQHSTGPRTPKKLKRPKPVSDWHDPSIFSNGAVTQQYGSYFFGTSNRFRILSTRIELLPFRLPIYTVRSRFVQQLLPFIVYFYFKQSVRQSRP